MKKTFKVTPLRIEVRPSKLLPGEIGLFIVRSIKKNEIIARADKLGEHFVPWKEFKKLDKITQRKAIQYCLQTEEGFYVPEDFNYLTVPWNMNHSCSYNVGFDKVGNFVAVRNLKKNEELVWDYGMGQSYPKFKLHCKCGSKNCRKVITGNDWKNKVFVQENKKYFLRDLLKKAEK